MSLQSLLGVAAVKGICVAAVSFPVLFPFSSVRYWLILGHIFTLGGQKNSENTFEMKVGRKRENSSEGAADQAISLQSRGVARDAPQLIYTL